ncbi:hypothetical protein SAMN05421678_10213 [Actinopolymorpha cephalotaxi]|uniref:YbaB/EbfC DNA-binding family protein n=1 Tax=Actinopolymorpha cephalotaxi TaxID=504797 RepID=A0A1I2LAU0_9ACTN|nr:YbaB/EbfC family nucleoid-associated protein [Actinopolymorpha cephalotaxi]NYH85017.1 hypothetical protein [Actinopolymorpha cephalotaxi]SFF75658.1 hypothetical protein SAMN05421678_10213 [Actinopolymorpha cephalotaxi]
MSRPLDDDEVELTDQGEFDQGFASAREQLDDLLAGHAPETDSEEGAGEELRGVGEAADGRIVATVGVGGRLESINLDPRALRSAPDQLGQQFTESINAALDDLRSKAAQTTGQDTVVDPRVIAEDLDQVQNVLTEHVASLTERYDDAIAQLRRQAEEG